MRLTQFSLRGKPPIPAKEVPPQERLPLRLRDRVTTCKGGKERACLQELSLLIACLHQNDHSNSPCAKELSNLQKCHKEAVTRHKEKLELQKKGELTHEMKDFTNKQITNLLKKYPTV